MDDNFAQSTALKPEQPVMFQTLPLSLLINGTMHSLSANGQVVGQASVPLILRGFDADGGGDWQTRDVGLLYSADDAGRRHEVAK